MSLQEKLDQHQKRVMHVLQQPMYHTKPRSHMLQSRQGRDLQTLHHILDLNLTEKWILLEPYITFQQIVKYTLKHHLIPPVVPEFKHITLGGAIMGAALESSSFRYGQVSDCALGYELILGDGSIVWVDATHHADLFYGVSGSYGTLALLTCVKLRLIPAAPSVTLSLRKTTTLAFHETCDFSEAILMPDHKFLHLDGVLSKTPSPKQLQHPWSFTFYQYLLNSQDTTTWSLPLEEYLFRYDKGAFWMGHYALAFGVLKALFLKQKIFQSPPPMRFWHRCFSPLLSSHILYRLLHQLSKRDCESLFLIHDFYIPQSRVQEALEDLLRTTNILPIWLCPVKATLTPQILSPHFGRENWINLGCYGIPQTSSSRVCTKHLEDKILSFGGRKMLYSLTCHSRETFDLIYGGVAYQNLRRLYGAEGVFPTLYEKCSHGT